MTNDRQISILRSSFDEFNKISINDNDILILKKIKDGKIVSHNSIVNNIKNYSTAIDIEDKIHIAYSNDNINLKYMVLSPTNKVISIISAKNGLTLRCINIKILDTDPHIFYTLTDVDHNIHIICHSFCVKGFWKTNEIIQSIGNRYIQPYLIETYNKKIFLMVYKNHWEGKLELFRMEDTDNSWTKMEKNIELENSNNVSFFICPKSIAVITYNKLINRNLQTIIMYKNLTSKTYESWKSCVLSDKDFNTLKPSIFYEKGYYYITWVQGANVVLKRSKELICWEDILTFDINSSDYIKCFYMSNNSMDSDLKVNGLFFLKIVNLNLTINQQCEDKISKEKFPLSSERPYIKILEAKLKLLDKELNKRIHENNLMKSNITYLNYIIDQYKDQIAKLNNNSISAVQEVTNQRINFLHEIISRKEENDTLILKNISKLSNMLRIIDEKDKLINDLNKRINK